MAISVNGGPLELTMSLDLDSFETDLQKGIEQATANSKQLETALREAATGGAGAIKNILLEVESISERIAPLIQKGLAGIDSRKLNIFSEEIKGVTDEFSLLNKTIGFLKENLSSLNLNPEELANLQQGITAIDQAFQTITPKERSATAQLKEFKDQLFKLSPGGSLFQQTLKQASDLQEKIKSVKSELKLAGSNAPGILATSQALGGVVAGLQAFEGSLALVAGKSEDVEKSIQTLIASMSILQGIEEVSKVLEKDSALNVFLTSQLRNKAAIATEAQAAATASLATVQGVEAAAAEEAAIAQESFNTALAANPAAILLLGLTSLVAAIQFFSSETKDATDQLKGLNLELEKISGAANATIDKIKFLADLNGDQARARGALESEITKQNIEGYRQEADEYRKSIGEKILSARKFMSAGFNLESKDLVTTNLNNVETDLLNNKLSKGDRGELERERDFLKSVLADFNGLENAEHNLAKATVQLAQQSFQEALRSAQGYADARLLLAKKNTEQELELQVQAIHARAAAELAGQNLTAGERRRITAQEQKDIQDATNRFKLVGLNDEKAAIQARLDAVKEGSKEELDLRLDLIRKNAEIELEQVGLTEAQKSEIKANEAKHIADLTKKYNYELQQDEIQAAISITNSKISLAREGSKEELDLKIQAVNQQAKLDISRANEEIKNEQLLQARVQEIIATSIASRKQLEEDYVKNVLDKLFYQIERKTKDKNRPFQDILDSFTSTAFEKQAAKINILRNNLEKLQQEQEKVAQQLREGVGDCEALTKQFDELGDSVHEAKNELANAAKSAFPDRMKDLAADVSNISSALGQLASSLEDVNPELANALQTMSDVGNVAGAAISAIGQFASGDIPGAVASALKAITGIFNIGKKQREEQRKRKEEMESFLLAQFQGEQEINELYRERAREQIKINKYRLEGLKAEHDLLVKQKGDIALQFKTVLSELQKQTAKIRKAGFLGIPSNSFTTESLAGKSFDELEQLFLKGQLEGKAKDLFETLQKIRQEGVDVDKMLQENAQTLKETLTGTTADSISDSIIDGFKNGLKSATDFADTFQDLMRQALIQSLKFKYLEGPLNDFFDEFAAAAESDNQLTSGEVSQLNQMFNNIISNANEQFQQLQQIAGINFNSGSAATNSLTGAIKGITEQQAELLAGQFGGLRITALDALSVSRQQLTALGKIENNTALTVVRMQTMIDKLIYYFETKGVKVY